MWGSSFDPDGNAQAMAHAAAKARAQYEGADQLARAVPTDLIRQFTIIGADECAELEAWFSL